MKPSKLWRSFSATTNMFTLKIGENVIGDDEIISITITRGGGSYGSNPTVLEVELTGNRVYYRNEHVTLMINEQYARAVTINPAQITHRFVGRLAEIETTDNGDKKLNTSRITCTSYSALLRMSPVTIPVAHRDAISDVITKAISAPRLSGHAKLFELASTAILDSGRIWVGDTTPLQKTYKEVLQDYVEPVKTLIVDRRDGYMRFMTLALRLAVLSSQVHKAAPLRSSVLSPVKWKQSNEVRSNNLRYFWREQDGTVLTRNYVATSSLDALVSDVEPVEHDLTDMLIIDETRELIRLAEDGASNMVQRGYESINVSILELLANGSDYQRSVCFEMLRLEHGDAVYFGGDWTKQRYPMINTQIRETITPKQWLFEIELAHPRSVLGVVNLPDYPAQVWDQAVLPWDDTTQTWDGA